VVGASSAKVRSCEGEGFGAGAGAALCGLVCPGEAAGALEGGSGFFVAQPAAMISIRNADAPKTICLNFILIHLSCDDFFLLSPKKENICMIVSNISWHTQNF
jgi:hypothetical protein